MGNFGPHQKAKEEHIRAYLRSIKMATILQNKINNNNTFLKQQEGTEKDDEVDKKGKPKRRNALKPLI